jgi:hypothetical protein
MDADSDLACPPVVGTFKPVVSFGVVYCGLIVGRGLEGEGDRKVVPAGA